MLGEVYEILKFLIGIINGEYSKTFFYILLFFIIIIVITEIIIDRKMGENDNYFYLILEKVFWNVLGVIFYISIYMFMVQIATNLPFFSLLKDNDNIFGEMGILSYITTVTILPISFIIIKARQTIIKCVLVIIQFLIVMLVTKILLSLFNLTGTFNYPLLVLHTLLSIVISNILLYYSHSKIS
ncbi:hypothetical protein FH115_10980 [Staphylococcus hominis]|uniref:hypothetical protein n=1 Tax=Staphylococcus hominis TaxID=1290 RepID=UPI001F5AA69D|nr:hypothetical protein [Staphylococcus hominis]MCI2870181.1 hypothetical protein [Staphylococcus hominis]MDS3894755.1 hypothetical protein [Staphylococcus hominis]